MAAVVVPLLLFGLFERQTRRLDALRDRGVEAVGTVTGRSSDGGIVYYAYEVAGQRQTWNVRAEELAMEPGQTFALTYLPDDPGMSRPGFPYTPERRAAENKPGIHYGVPAGFFVALGSFALLCHRALLKSRQGLAATPGKPVPVETLARVLAVIFYAVLLGSTQTTDALEVFQKLWGVAPVGVPLRLAVALAATVAFAPFALLLRHLVPFLTGGDEISVVVRLLQAPPALRRSRNLALLGIVYFFLLMFGWIAYAALRGV